MDDPISVVVRTIPDREHFLDKCLFTLSGQTHQNIEVLIVSQQTGDGKGSSMIEDVVDRWKEGFAGVKVFAHTSEADARAKSLNIRKRAVRDRYLAFLDDDDKVYSQHNEKLIKSLAATDHAWAYTDIVQDDLSSSNEDYDFTLRLAFKHGPLYVSGFGVGYCIRNDGSKRVSDGISTARVSAEEPALEYCQTLLDDKKLENFGWWVRELGRLPAVNPTGLSQDGMNHGDEWDSVTGPLAQPPARVLRDEILAIHPLLPRCPEPHSPSPDTGRRRARK
ncbi:putative glycosyl transferase [Caballeronia choica]|uniref:Glycosyl transferase n=1 Tax=Caballeronia choica TaxID=326476 RepID=A0A158KYR5_9BURK|nr:glycosyltransferase family A protein [Caballeronia choica]SAL86288.1 putative glycosyl transferase [Caballeronia choica]